MISLYRTLNNVFYEIWKGPCLDRSLRRNDSHDFRTLISTGDRLGFLRELALKKRLTSLRII